MNINLAIIAPNTDFQYINPFFIFYHEDEGRRSYHVKSLGCVTSDILEASRYEIDSYVNDLGGISEGNLRPIYVTVPICAHRPSPGVDYEFYAGKHRIQLDPRCGKTVIHQVACGAKRIARPTFRLGGPFGAVVQTVAHSEGVVHVAYFGIDILFFTHEDEQAPDSLVGFTKIGDNHFTSIPRFW